MKNASYHPFRSIRAKAEYHALYAQRAKAWPVAAETRWVETPAGQTFVRVSGPVDAYVFMDTRVTQPAWLTDNGWTFLGSGLMGIDEAGDGVGGPSVQSLAGEPDLAALQRDQSEQRAQRRRPAHAVATEERGDLAFADGEIDTEQHLAGAVACLDSTQLEQAHRTSSEPR